MGEKGELDESNGVSQDPVEGRFGFTDPARVERRVWRNIFAIIALAIALAAIFTDARCTASLALGSVLALLNFKWLHASLRAVLGVGGSAAPPGTTMKFIFRWLVVGAVIYGAIRTGWFYVVPIMVGLFAPAMAVMIEAVYMTYKTLKEDHKGK
ncbi:MAG: ATP synthase subunit I [Blastocatellia bacterium]|nr:ATP synthase subunit I [Blastocatellia bacterium]